MFRMFFNAWDFNQDLCNFGDNMSQLSNSQITSITMGMFDNSGCSDKDPPTSASGPWCAVTSCRPRRSIKIQKICVYGKGECERIDVGNTGII